MLDITYLLEGPASSTRGIEKHPIGPFGIYTMNPSNPEGFIKSTNVPRELNNCNRIPDLKIPDTQSTILLGHTHFKPADIALRGIIRITLP